MLVKICGIKTEEIAHTAVHLGADLLGFVFAKSKRKVTPETASIIVKSLSPTTKKVGVFVNESVERMIQIAEYVGLDYIQLHGEEPASTAEQLPYPIIKAFSIDQEIGSYPCDFYLLDGPKGKYHGGNGKTFNWKIVQQLNLDSKKIILAGGLTPENVQEAIRIVKPAGVDVSSGVETKGKKDPDKIIQFIACAKKVRKDDTFGKLHNAR